MNSETGLSQDSIKQATPDKRIVAEFSWLVYFKGCSLLAFFIASVPGCATLAESPVYSVISLPAEHPLTIRNSPLIAISPDGRSIVYAADIEGRESRQLYLRETNSDSGRLVEGTREGEMPFFSPDGAWIGFFSEGKLRKVSLNSGQVVTLADIQSPSGASWRQDDKILFGSAGSIWQVPASGGIPMQLTIAGKGETHGWPAALPDTSLVLFNLWEQGKSTPSIVIEQTDTGKRNTLIAEGNSPRYSPTGHVLYTDLATLKAVAVDIHTGMVTGKPVTLLEGVLVSPGTGVAQYGIASNGAVLYAAGGVFGSARRVVLIDRQGQERDAGLPPGRYGYVQYSPDGRQLALETGDAVPEIWRYDLEHKTMSLLAKDASFPVWTPDGKWVTFASNQAGIPGIFRVSVENTLNVEQLTVGQYPRDHSYAWSPDGSSLAYTEIHPDSGMDIHLSTMKGEQVSLPWAQSNAQECCPVFSPDGHLLSFISDVSGRPEIYIGKVSAPGQGWQVSTNGGREPVWSRDGKELFYWQGRQLMSVGISSATEPVKSQPVPLFEGVFVSSTSTWRTRYDVSPDGREFIIIRRGPEESGVTGLRLMTDSFTQLKN